MGAFRDSVLKLLNEAKESGELVGIHQWDDDPSIFLVGFVLECRPKLVVMRDVGTCGEVDEERRELDPNDIVRVQTRNQYLERIRVLYENHDRITWPGHSFFGIDPTDQLRLLTEAVDEGRFVTIWGHEETDDDSSVSGIPVKVEGECLLFRPMLDDGTFDGEILYRLSDIAKVEAGGDGQAADAFFAAWRRENPRVR